MAKPEDNHARLISEVTAITPGRPFWVGIYLQTARGWHTYWRNPGDSGSPTDVQLKLPAGWKASPVYWPAPVRIDLAGTVSYGYEKPTLLLMRLTPPDKPLGRHVDLRGRVRWLTCTAEVCVPAKGDLSLTLPVAKTNAGDHSWKELFARSLSSLPKPSKGWAGTASLEKGTIRLHLKCPGGESASYLFPIESGVLDQSRPQLFHRSPDGLDAELTVSEYAQHPPSRLRGVLLTNSANPTESHQSAITIDIPITNP
ncbi:MAG TPA: protein-disulfide reductase DsbD domain-containing protein [Fimbriimonas sp.]|nr:protein-disulfide reductase DsbD domain-containing protein [Fimbriimonas sp.]